MTNTEIILAGGERVEVSGDAKQAETTVVSAARGSILELAWLTEAHTGRRVGINPDHVLMIRAPDNDVDGPALGDPDAASAGGVAGQDLNGAAVSPDR